MAEDMNSYQQGTRKLSSPSILIPVLLLASLLLVLPAEAKTHYINTLGNGNISFGSSDQLFIDNTNNRVGLGTSTPSDLFEIYNGGDLLLEDGAGSDPGQIIFKDAYNNVMGMIIANESGTSVASLHLCGDDSHADITIDDDGYVGINTTDPAEPFHIVSGMQQLSLNYSSTAYTGVTTDSSGYMTIAPSSSRIYLGAGNSDVDVIIPDGGLVISSSAVSPSIPTDGNMEIEDGALCIAAGGCAAGSDGELSVKGGGINSEKIYASDLTTITSTTGYYQLAIGSAKVKDVKAYTSSERYKTDITDLKTDPEAFLALQPVEFTDKGYGMRGIGLIAEKVAEKVPEIVSYDEQGRPDGVNYNLLGVLAIHTAKDNQNIIDENRELLNNIQYEGEELENRMDVLKKRLEEAEQSVMAREGQGDA